jgi:hypothetical protein
MMLEPFCAAEADTAKQKALCETAEFPARLGHLT